jgi:hypothetical protein
LKGTNGYDHRTCPLCGDLLDETDANVVVVDRQGGMAHRACPAVALEVAELTVGRPDPMEVASEALEKLRLLPK